MKLFIAYKDNLWADDGVVLIVAESEARAKEIAVTNGVKGEPREIENGIIAAPPERIFNPFWDVPGAI